MIFYTLEVLRYFFTEARFYHPVVLSYFFPEARFYHLEVPLGWFIWQSYVPKVWYLMVSGAIPIPLGPNNMKQVQKFQSDVVFYCPQPMFVYIVNPLVKENRPRQFSKIWLPKVFKWVLMFINHIFSSPMTIRSG